MSSTVTEFCFPIWNTLPTRLWPPLDSFVEGSILVSILENSFFMIDYIQFSDKMRNAKKVIGLWALEKKKENVSTIATQLTSLKTRSNSRVHSIEG